MKWLTRTLLLFGVLTACQAFAQQMPCQQEMLEFPVGNTCPTSGHSWTTANTPFVDADCTNGCPSYNDGYGDVISLYGHYGNRETTGNAAAHAALGVYLGSSSSITPLCADGSAPPNCTNGQAPAIVVLVLGFSNCEIEVCGGSEDIWQDDPNLLSGQPCATYYGGCPNLNNPNPNSPNPYNAYAMGDTKLQESFLYQVYSPTPHLVGSHVVIFNAAVGSQSLDHWDPSATHGFNTHACSVFGLPQHDPECDYDATALALAHNGYSESQVQVIYFKSSQEVPDCDLKNAYCSVNPPAPNAFVEEQYLGNILRYLKCCKLDKDGNPLPGDPRYPNLKQVFLSTRTYGGYANGTAHGCLSPEPYAYEEGFAVQRLIVAQIDSTPDTTGGSGAVDTSVAPWFDWGPYLWADGQNPRSDGLIWCSQQTRGVCAGQNDVRYGDPNDSTGMYWGDFTHPTADGAKKAADQMVTFFTKDVASGGSQFVQGWKGQ